MPAQIGPYQILEELGRGAMGVVFRGLDPSINRAVAIKVIRSQEFSTADENAEARLRFTREASAAGRLSHPNIVTVYQLGEERDFQYLVMELVPGNSLEKLMGTGTPMKPEQALGILRPIADALDHAHGEGVVHRDIKPANILVRPDGKVKITDFGIARVVSQTLTKTGVSFGTPAYMSPEQFMSSKVDGRVDQFSLAVMAYELLSGRKPFEADAPHTLMLRIMNEEPEPIHKVNPALPKDCSKVFERALAKSAAARYANCSEFIQVLASNLESKGSPNKASDLSRQTPTPLLEPTLSETFKNAAPSRRAVVVGALTVGLLAGSVLFIWRGRTTEAPSFPVATVPDNRPKKGDVKTNLKDGLRYAFIPAGSFQMGCSPDDRECDSDEKPAHRVTNSRPFWLGQTEVTVESYRRFAAANGKSLPSETTLNPGWASGKLPMVNVDWNDANGYCVWIGGRLPTEAEWE